MNNPTINDTINATNEVIALMQQSHNRFWTNEVNRWEECIVNRLHNMNHAIRVSSDVNNDIDVKYWSDSVDRAIDGLQASKRMLIQAVN